jgi:hypothetical protein
MLVKVCSLEWLKKNFEYFEWKGEYYYSTGIVGDKLFPEKMVKYCGKIFEVDNTWSCGGYITGYELIGIENYIFEPQYLNSIVLEDIKKKLIYKELEKSVKN